MDFKDFCEQKINDTAENQTFKYNRASSSQSQEDINKQAESAYNQYANMSQEQLMGELIKKTNQKKQDGSLSPEKMEQMYQTIYNILPPENRKNLEDIFKKLK